jgi:hypothetical protein
VADGMDREAATVKRMLWIGYLDLAAISQMKLADWGTDLVFRARR